MLDNRIKDVFASGNNIYAATEGGLSISTDGGANWSTSTQANGLGTGGLGSNLVRGLAVSGGTIYAGTNGGGLSVSTNGGSSWTTYTTADGLGANFLQKMYISDNTLYVATSNGGLSVAALQNSTPVPGPLPVLGAASAFGYSRRLRRRLRASSCAYLSR